MMSNYMLEYLRSKFATATVSELAQTTGESPALTQKAIDGLLPAVVAGVINRANQSDGVALIHRLLNDATFDSDDLKQVVDANEQRRKAAEAGNEFLTKIQPGQIDRLTEETATYSGVKKASASTMAGLVASVLMGYLRTQIRTKNLTELQLAPVLNDETDGIRTALPTALGVAVAWLTGLGPTRAATIPVAPVTRPVTPAAAPVATAPVADDDRKGGGWWRWLLLGLGLLALFLLLTRMCNRDKTETKSTGTETTAGADTVTSVASDTNSNAGASTTAGPEVRVGVDLPGGRKLNVTENSFNYSVAKFLATKGGQVPKVFTFNNLTFETNSARITAKARPNVDDLIEIMKAYPSLNIRIEGNTDSTGPEDLNDPLSAERAEAVKAALVKAGVEAGRVATRELGDKKPVASNETAAGRQKNRRIDVVITKL